MCGIFGLVAGSSSDADRGAVLRSVLRELFLLSETRGGEAAGLAVRRRDRVAIFKSPLPATKMLGETGFRAFLDDVLPAGPSDGSLAAIGQCRLVTNGREADETNNQPVVVEPLVGVHNGIVVNDRDIWRDNPELARRAEVDSEAILALMARSLRVGHDLAKAAADAFAAIEGETSIAVLPSDRDLLLLATNTGSIYWAELAEISGLVFASEEWILKNALAQGWRGGGGEVRPIRHLGAGRGLIYNLAKGECRDFALASPPPDAATAPIKIAPIVQASRKPLLRCTRCILPETFPLIEFDQSGTCNYCRNFDPVRYEGRDALERTVARHRRSDGRPDCIVALSGGRDSCYGLHVIKKELGLNPIAFTYDWGLVTDLARRNQARICGKLGVEHIWRTADIPAKRRYVRANLEAWMRRPTLGMIPLFTAGDKEFYRHARQLRKELGIDLVIFCAGNRYEETRFKTGFAGVRESHHRNVMTRISLSNKVQLAAYYAAQIAINPRYLNTSLFDSLRAFAETYIKTDDFTYLYHYMPWDETKVVETLRKEYDWELAPDTRTTWRIGDATAAFYNYVYYQVAGFSEHDTFRSNQVRAGALDRDKALELAENDNRTRYDAIDDYAKLVGVSANEIHRTVLAMPKLAPRHAA